MSTNISRKLLVATLAISIIACSQLDAMKRTREENREIENTQALANQRPELVSDVVLNILSTLDVLNNGGAPMGPQEILSIAQLVRKGFGLDTNGTLHVLEIYLRPRYQAQNQSIGNFLASTVGYDHLNRTALHRAVVQNDLDSVRILCLLAGNDICNLMCA